MLSPINLKESLDSKEIANLRQKQHVLGRDSSKVASIQLRSLRNLPQINELASRRKNESKLYKNTRIKSEVAFLRKPEACTKIKF